MQGADRALPAQEPVQLSQVYPKPEANGRHAIGAHSFDWGEWRVLPAVGEDFLHLTWRWLDCCLTF